MITTRVPLATKPGIRVVLEVDQDDAPPLTQAFLKRIDAIREALAHGSITPDDAHAYLIDCRWIGKLAGTGVASGMRALCAPVALERAA